MRRRATERRRRILVLLALLSFVAGMVVARVGGDDEGGDERDTLPVAEARPELPQGGRSLLPEYQLVGYYGAPQADELGALGIGKPADAAAQLEKQAKAYDTKRPTQLVFELLASVAANAPGEDGLYINRQPRRVIEEYLDEARRHDAILLLDIQPGRADFADEVRRLMPYLREPDVGLALDPEWHVGPDQIPGQVIGSVDATEVNTVSAMLADQIERFDLPEKLFVIHQFTEDMIARRNLLRSRDGLATVINLDGFGDEANKVSKYLALQPERGSGLYAGFKLFYSEDVGLMSPKTVLGLDPRPSLIVYE